MERELDDELRFHLEESIDAHMPAGHTRDEATRRAHFELGGVEIVKQEVRDLRTDSTKTTNSSVRHGQ
jgi:hypothetical protein